MKGLEIVDYNKSFKNQMNELLVKQWNEKFVHKNKFIGKVALVNNEFAGFCIGYFKFNYFYFYEFCVENKFRCQGIGTKP